MLLVLGPPLWLEGDWHLLTLEEPCRIRVVEAEVWRIVQARDIKHFERVTEFLDVTYTLVPRLVTPIKHMKIMFGLQVSSLIL
uniref:TERF1-interacting nuclear factor 2 N-terminal domain-containing protein n=1 Tax=Sinocyclocheilus grahami TaxID=75366 RepID=A0A672PMB4_SINGR